jgi:hypothetical protein
VKNDMRIKGVSMEMKSDRREWKRKTCCASGNDDDELRKINYADLYTFLSHKVNNSNLTNKIKTLLKLLSSLEFIPIFYAAIGGKRS